jgi:Cu(I)/Ag(I) efflux system membrane fusion protein
MENNKSWWKQWTQQRFRWPLLVILLLVFLIGYWIRGGGGDQINHTSHEAAGEMSADQTTGVQMWTCSMHPQIRKPEPGDCPICGMDLVPVADTPEEQLGPRQLKLSPWAVKLAEIETAPVQRRRLSANLRLAGKVEYDETRLKYISARVPGRIDRLFVDYTGSAVGKGDPLVKLYSPELIVAQQELLQARQTLGQLQKRTLAAAREKLRLWGISDRQIREIEKRKSPAQHLTIFSPIAGVVVHKNAVEGLYVQTGTRIYTIADLSRVWVKMDVYESDLSRLEPGQTVEFETEAYPGEVFRGKVAFIDPVLDPRTRTVKVRVDASNPGNKLKPEMLVRAKLHALSADRQEEPLAIPATAPLLTGKRAVVYVAAPGKEGVFEGREVVLGPRVGDYYEVKEGVAEGEMVVVNGAFKIDSDLQIRAKPSMMNPEGGGPAPEHHHQERPAAPPDRKRDQENES